MKRDTRLQHLGERREENLGAATPPIYRTSLFAFPDVASLEAWFRGKRDRYLYSRSANPTVRLLEEKVADLERADDALAFSSGMGAISAVLLGWLRAGDHLVVAARAYAPTLILVRDLLERLGISVTRLGPQEVPRLESYLEQNTRLIYMESPSSLTFEVLDLEQVAEVARRRGIVTVADNSWATPLYQQPVALGIDLVVHSGTKYVGGHSDILLGLAAGTRGAMGRVRKVASLLGACLSPEDAFLALRGLRTLPLRMARHQESGLLIASRLSEHPRVIDVYHPALTSFASHSRWQKQFSGASGLFSFLIDGDARRFCDALRVFLLGVSWGGHESLALPAAVSAPESPEHNVRPDVPDNLIRLSIGLEDPEDLWEDLERGFAAAR
jgi:cystathionine beta-lyase